MTVGAEKISSTELLDIIGISPADNRMGLSLALPWRSNLGGEQAKSLFQYQRFLDKISENYTIFGPLAVFAGFQNALLKTYLLEPIKAHARISARSGREPDIFRDMNGWIYKNYARLLYQLCDYFIQDGRFSREKALATSSSPPGKKILKEYLREFAQLEYLYNAVGLTRLTAMKELLQCLLVVITETPLDGKPLPFMRKNADGTDALSFDAYLAENRLRFESLHRLNAFDPKEYSERATQGAIGCSPYDFVNGSMIRHVQLRRYRPVEGVRQNGAVIYLSTPLINKPELFDLAPGKSVVEGLLREGYAIYLVDYGHPGPDDAELGFDFYAKTVHDHNLALIKQLHPRSALYVLGYCMGGTIAVAYLARRAEERLAAGKKMDVAKVALMASPVKFDDGESGQGPMRDYLRRHYDPQLMEELFGSVNVPPQMIDFGMNDIQPGVHYTVLSGFYGRAIHPEAVIDAAPFLYWLTHGTKFPAQAHRDWVEKFFLGNELFEGKFCLPSDNPHLNGKPVNMDALRLGSVQIFDYRGTRDPIAPPGSCVASQIWGMRQGGNISITRSGLNRTIEKNIGHIFVVSRQLLGEYLHAVSGFLRGEPCENVDGINECLSPDEERHGL